MVQWDMDCYGVKVNKIRWKAYQKYEIFEYNYFRNLGATGKANIYSPSQIALEDDGELLLNSYSLVKVLAQ